MMDRRTFIKLGVGSVVANLAWPVIALGKSHNERINTLVVYHEDSAEGLQFFKNVLEKGAEGFPINGILDPARKQQFFRRLTKEPTMVIGLTNSHSAFELQMAAGDAFHFNVPEEQFVVEKSGDGSLVPWAVAPIAEIRGGKA